MNKAAARFSGYSGITDSLPQQPTQAQVRQLASKLKTYVNSTKFLKPGATINVYSKKLGQTVKLPVENVRYMAQRGGQSISHNQLKEMIMRGIIDNDANALRNASAYRYVQGDTGKSQQQLKQQQQQRIKAQQQVNRSDKAKLGWLLGGAGALAGATLPYVAQQLQQRPHNVHTYINGIMTGAAGGFAGVGLAGLIHAMRNIKQQEA